MCSPGLQRHAQFSHATSTTAQFVIFYNHPWYLSIAVPPDEWFAQFNWLLIYTHWVVYLNPTIKKDKTANGNPTEFHVLLLIFRIWFMGSDSKHDLFPEAH